MAEHATVTAVRQNAPKAAGPQPASETATRQGLRPDGGLYELQKALGNYAMQRSLLAGQSGIPDVLRKCASCAQHDDIAGVLQTKLTVNQPGDVFEQEADRVAEAAMSGGPALENAVSDESASANLQRACACGGTCDDCQRKVDVVQRATPGSAAREANAPPIVHQVLRSPGRPLDTATRTFMESRLGADFSDVRVHTDSLAAESAGSINALAYTVGRDVVFGPGQFTSGNQVRQRLLAHELAHVIQQDRGGATRVQRVCSKSDLGPPPTECHLDHSLTPSTSRYLFNVDCDDFAPGEEARLAKDAAAFGAKSTVNILGLASSDGPAKLNDTLSCLRADKAVAVVKRSIKPTVTIGSVGAAGGLGPSGDITFRAASVDVSTPKEKPKCGPDATDWFVSQVNTALRDKDVLAVQGLLAAADSIARTRGTSANTFAEAGAAAAIEAQLAKLLAAGPTPPALSGAIVGQLAAGIKSEKAAAAAPGAALLADPLSPLAVSSDFLTLNGLIAAAALKWKSLVDHHARYDFKNHADSMDQPHSTHCPDPECPPTEHGTITLCPGAASSNCYESDLPGNLFYAFIGRFIGWSELTLQLGSELAELTDLPRAGRPAITWDSPEDTAAIHLGFGLGAGLPLTRAALCGAVGPARSSLDGVAACDDCSELTPSVIR